MRTKEIHANIMLYLNCKLSNQKARFVPCGQSIYHRIAPPPPQLHGKFKLEYHTRVYSLLEWVIHLYSPLQLGIWDRVNTTMRGTKTRLWTMAEQEIVLPEKFPLVLPQYSRFFWYYQPYFLPSAWGIRWNTVLPFWTIYPSGQYFIEFFSLRFYKW